MDWVCRLKDDAGPPALLIGVGNRHAEESRMCRMAGVS